MTIRIVYGKTFGLSRHVELGVGSDQHRQRQAGSEAQIAQFESHRKLYGIIAAQPMPFR